MSEKEVRIGKILFCNGMYGNIDELIEGMVKAKEKGATKYKFVHRPSSYDERSIDFIRIRTDEEIKQEKIEKLERELKALRND